MRGRFAPSPTGYMHLGNAWVALLAWLQVRQQGGTFVLRIEDIDEQRSKAIYEDAIMRDLHWLGLDWDEGPNQGGASGPYVQQQRYDRYETALAALKGQGLLYPCYCSRARLQAIAGAPHAGEAYVYDRHCYGLSQAQQASMTKVPSWRIHVPDETISFTDGLYGLQEAYLPSACGDFVVRRADGMFAYQLAVSVDDAAMGMTHVLRGRDLLASAAPQIWLIRLLGGTAPAYMHVPMLMDKSGERLSKRQQGITLGQLRDAGLTGEQVIAYLAYKGNLIDRFEELRPSQLIQSFNSLKLEKENIYIEEDVLEAIQHLVNKI